MELQENIEKQLEEQKDDLIEEIARGCEHTDSTEVVCGKMIANAIVISTRVSAGMLFDILVDLGIAEPYSDNDLRKRKMSVLKGQDKY